MGLNPYITQKHVYIPNWRYLCMSGTYIEMCMPKANFRIDCPTFILSHTIFFTISVHSNSMLFLPSAKTLSLAWISFGLMPTNNTSHILSSDYILNLSTSHSPLSSWFFSQQYPKDIFLVMEISYIHAVCSVVMSHIWVLSTWNLVVPPRNLIFNFILFKLV